MPPRHAYWTILVDDQPTAFRAHDAAELEPTLNRLRERHPSAVMKWFERGKLFDSRDEAREQGYGKGERRWEGPRPDRTGDGPPRDRNWRPGGEHRDPRQKYKDAKKAKWDRFKQKIRDRAERPPAPRHEVDPESFSPPHGDPLRDQIDHDREPPRRESRDGAPSRPHGDAMRPAAGPGGRPERRGGGKRQPDRRSEWRPSDRAPFRDDRRSRPPRERDRFTPEWRKESTRGGPRQEGGWSNRPPRDRDRPRGDREFPRDGWSDNRQRNRPEDRREGRFEDRRVERDRDRNRPPRRETESRGQWRDARGERPRSGPRQPSGGGAGKPSTRSKPPWHGANKKPWGTRPGGGKPPGKPAGRKGGAPPRRGPRKRRDDE